MTKVCRICGLEKKEDEFYPRYSSPGLKNECKRCQNFSRRYNLVSNMVSNAKQRAKRNKLEFEVDKEFVLYLRDKQDNKCALSGWNLDWDHTKSGRRICPPDRASLDRIDSDKGYTKDNVQLVADAVNRIKNHYPEELFLNMCLDIVRWCNLPKNS